MAYVDNHTDLNKIKDKPIYGFTIRQVVSFAVIVAIAIPLYAIMLANHLDTTVACLIIGIIAFPIFFAGTYEDINGRTLEKILWAKIRLMMLTNAKRPFATNNTYEAIKNQRKLEKKYFELRKKEAIRRKKLAEKKNSRVLPFRRKKTEKAAKKTETA